ncbi:Mo25 family protein [Abeliophyllum distichum]|uniref:Mo25 family protein n=1 Tax=Abeliophyllum distichum TaxID=126358 RepID=A0ABD1UGR4_9LAMI
MRTMLLGDVEVEPNMDQVSQLTLEICNEDVISLFIHNLSILGWEAIHGEPSGVTGLLCSLDLLTKHPPAVSEFLTTHYDEVYIANPSKPREIKIILAKNHEKLLALLYDLSPGRGIAGGEDDQFEEEKELIIKEIERVSRLKS